MRVHQTLFDLGDTGLVALSTCTSSYGLVPASFGIAELWRDGERFDLADLCTRPLPADAQAAAMAALRRRLAGAVPSVHRQLDWAQAQQAADNRELPTYACQIGSDLLLGFVGAVRPWTWRLVDVANRRIAWENAADLAGVAPAPPPAMAAFALDAQLPVAAGAGFVQLQIGLARVVFVRDGDALVPAPWSLARTDVADNVGVGAGLLARREDGANVFDRIDPRSGAVTATIVAPTPSKGYSRAAGTPGSDRFAISHDGGTIDLVDGFGAAHVSLRPFPATARTRQLPVQLAHAGDYLGIDGWHVFRIVDVARRLVAEVAVPEPNLGDDPGGVRYDRAVLATGRGLAVVEGRDVRVLPYAGMRWEAATLAGPGSRKQAAGVRDDAFAAWRRPALALAPAEQGTSWLYGTPDLADADVPRHDGRAMQLLARIDLADAAARHADAPWPRAGALYFFTAVDADGEPLQDAVFNLSTTRVLHRAGGAACGAGPALAPRRFLRLGAHAADLPDVAAAIVAAAGLDDARLEAYRGFLEAKALADQPGGHRLGGYPTIVQGNDLEFQAAHYGDGADPADPVAASRWRLLLQLESDDAMMWGTDSGLLYFLICDDDLARGEFSRVVSVCEGY